MFIVDPLGINMSLDSVKKIEHKMCIMSLCLNLTDSENKFLTQAVS